jgi:hypothetical protein
MPNARAVSKEKNYVRGLDLLVRMAGQACGRKGRLFFFLKKKEAKKTSITRAGLKTSGIGGWRDGLLRCARNDE